MVATHEENNGDDQCKPGKRPERYAPCRLRSIIVH